MPDKPLKGKVVLVTGAGSGLGEATAHAFAEVGCAVACVDVNRAGAEHVSSELASQDVQSIAFYCDVSNSHEVFQLVNTIHEHFGRLDIVVNCAAIDHTMSVEEMSIEQWDKVVAVNLRGPFLLAKAAWPIM